MISTRVEISFFILLFFFTNVCHSLLVAGRLQKKKRFIRATSNKTSEKSPLVSKIKRKLVSKGKEKSQLASKSKKQLDSKPSGKSPLEDRSSKKLNSKRTTFEKKSTKEKPREKKHTPPEKGFKVTKSK